MFSFKIKTICACLIFICINTASVFAGSNSTNLPDEAMQNELGMKYFKHGYYDLLPRGQKSEADQNLNQAEKAFQKSIEINKNYIDAHLNLARLYHLQGKFNQAALEYDNAITLEPENIDTYVQMAVVQTELGDFDEAIQYLRRAKSQTTDQEVIQKLNNYITKAEQAE